ncbi:actin cortical patch SUR7/pH-response regulator pali [Stachybotrys elegans]|uniref:Actin cortical patch SUR7/pH-response regulator pali n=1 Tax=Stachybotrys elegans TaxID=80388 RepID=A0A8K0SEX2_9HYPO|nr:actin cortical patch SUR7/pH-response regulator pali [Stachybotrys elegans]
MRVGRLLCVGLPVLLTTAALVVFLVAALSLSGATHHRLYLFRLDTEDLLIDPANIEGIAGRFLDANNKDIKIDKIDNITAEDLHLAKRYDVNIFGFCWIDQDSNDYHCSDRDFDWASNYLNTTTLDDLRSPSGVRIQLPDELNNALRIFLRISRWTQAAIVMALLALGIELIVGTLSNYSRLISAITWLIAGVAIIWVCIAASLVTAQAVVVVSAVETTTQWYGVHGQINGGFIATVWLGVAFAISSGLFWLFTICCCKPARGSRKTD